MEGSDSLMWWGLIRRYWVCVGGKREEVGNDV